MPNFSSLKFLAILLLFGSLASNLSAQVVHKFSGKVYSYGDPCDDVKVELKQAGEVVYTEVTKGNGKFTLEVQAESEYMLSLSKEGLKSKTIWINTKQTEKLAQQPPNFKFDVGLKKDKRSKYDELYEIPVALIKYDRKKQAFYMDDTYGDLLDRKKKRLRENAPRR